METPNITRGLGRYLRLYLSLRFIYLVTTLIKVRSTCSKYTMESLEVRS